MCELRPPMTPQTARERLDDPLRLEILARAVNMFTNNCIGKLYTMNSKRNLT